MYRTQKATGRCFYNKYFSTLWVLKNREISVDYKDERNNIFFDTYFYKHTDKKEKNFIHNFLFGGVFTRHTIPSHQDPFHKEKERNEKKKKIKRI